MSLALLICLLLLAALGHGYFWTDLVNRMHAWAGPRKVIDILTLGCFIAFIALPVLIAMNWSSLDVLGSSRTTPSASGLYYYLLACAVWGFACLVRNILYSRATDNPKVLTNWQQETIDFSAPESAEMFRAGLPQLLSKVPYNESLQLTVDRKRLAVPRLDSKLAGLKIAHISDLHMTGMIDRSWFEFVAEQVNLLQASAIFITGDIVEKEACWPWLAKSLGALEAPLGVYFILGNHDFYLDTDRTKQLLTDEGLVCLSERCLVTEWNGVPVQIAGNELPWSVHAGEFQNASATGADSAPFRLALLHSPDQFAWAGEQGVHLALAGHTHGGQIRFPLLGPIVSPSRYGTRYACGVFKRGNTVMHVSRGIAGKTPLRWNCPPEIALLELAAV